MYALHTARPGPGMPEQPTYRRARIVFGIVCLGTLAWVAVKKYQDRSFYRRWTVWRSYSDTLESWRSIASALRLLSEDFNSVVHGQSTEDCPESVRRVLALASSPACIEALSKAIGGLAAQTRREPAIIDKVLEAALSDRGQNLVGIVVGMSTTRAVQAVTQAMARANAERGQPICEQHPFMTWLASPAAQSLVCRSVATFVSTGVATYCDKTAGEDVYGDMLQALAQPRHLEAVQSLASTVCRTSVTAAVHSMRSSREPVSHSNGVSKAHPDTNGSQMRQGEAQPQRRPQAGQSTWSEAMIHACSYPDVRQTVAQAARAGCAGAVEAGLSTVTQQLASSRHAHLIATVLLSWLLLLPLWLLHTSLMLPGYT